MHKSRRVRRFLDKGDAKSITSADKVDNAAKVRRTTVQGALNLQLITAAFERKGKGKVTYSHCQHMKTETRAKIVG
jgi:hypothetical protein